MDGLDSLVLRHACHRCGVAGPLPIRLDGCRDWHCASLTGLRHQAGSSGPMNDHPRHRLDELIHQPVRFSIVAALAAAQEMEFAFLRDTVVVSDSLLSRYLTQLEEAGYVAIRKGYVGKRPRTWLSLSARGREVF